jgi:uncharacterized SAM-binding protein YcdF (DUF218 family)
MGLSQPTYDISNQITAIPDLLRFLFDLLKPSSHLLIVWVVCMMLFVVNRRRMALRCMAIGLVLLLIYTLPPLPRFLMGRLESTYPPFSVVASGEAAAPSDTFTQAASDSLFVLVLGAGADYDPALPPGQLLSATQMVRLAEGIRVARLMPEAVLVTSAFFEYCPHSQAEFTRRGAQGLGYTGRPIQVQEQPKTTCEEARAFVDAHGRGTRVLLVTSAAHMRRAMALFTAFGAEPMAAPCDFKVKHNPLRPFRWSDALPSWKHLDWLDELMKEQLALSLGPQC